MDVVRALHLDLTGRQLPESRSPLQRDYVVGQLDLPSAALWAWRQRHWPPRLLPRRGTERAWLCRDDPAPLLAEAAWFGGTVAGRLLSPVRR
ncbi:hypothetical protein GXW82_05200 [Streptacidiphilus sp. 4-A2]|nr:hypothetical protein [Streptacidiphilus sp. 4-A2]